MKPSSRLLIVAIIALPLVLYAGMVYLTIDTDYHLTIDAAERQAATLSSALEQHASRTLGEADSILDISIDNIVNHGWTQGQKQREFHDYVAAVQEKSPQIKAVFFVSPQGELRSVSSRYRSFSTNVSDRDYFRYHTIKPDPESYIGTALKSRIDGQWLFTITRRISNRDGSLKLIVGIAFEHDYFTRFYRTLDLGGVKGQVTLIRNDGSPLVMVPFSEPAMGGGQKSFPRVLERLQYAPRDIYRLASAQTQEVPRIVAYSSSPRYPLVSVISLPVDEVLQPWRTRALKHGAAAVASILLISTLTWTLISRFKRQEQANAELIEQRRELELAAHVFEQSKLSIVITDANGTILRVNRYFTELTGYDPEEAIGQTPRVLKSQRHDSKFYEEMWKSLVEQGHWKGEVWNRKKNGDGFAALLSISSVRDQAGRVLYYIGINEDITEQKTTAERVFHLAHFDILTDLPNRQLFNERVTVALQQSERYGRGLAILFLDLDNFKKVNDSLGHHAGDLLLQEIARRITGCLRKVDTVARLGGDEFAILVGDVKGATDVERLALKIISAVSKPVELEGTTQYVGVSIGASIYPTDGRDLVTLCKHADTAMYRAKSSGKNQCQFFDTHMAEQIARRLGMEADLRTGFPDQLYVLYQPQASLVDGAIIGAEALVRWRHPRLGLINPLEFIHIAEEIGLIDELGKWVLATACRQAAHWFHDKGISLRVAVNVSALQLAQPSFTREVAEILLETGLPSPLLELELTESKVMSNVEDAIAAFLRLKQLGITIAIDDFGTGYSSLSYLKKLPIDRLKIDRSFISDIPDNKEDVAIARTIIAMARSLNLQVLAEGVEGEPQCAFLKQEGCDEYQGYVLAQPLPAEELEQLLERQRNRGR